MVRADWLKPNAIVIDVGINFVAQQDGEKPLLCGDVEFSEETLTKVNKITPVPGGVGPMTIAMLLSNVVKSWDLNYPKK